MATSPFTLPSDHSEVRELHSEQIDELLKLQKAAQTITSILDLDELLKRPMPRENLPTNGAEVAARIISSRI